MKILIDLVDTGQVQFFRPIVERLMKDGHQVKVTARQKDITLFLLDHYKIPYECISQMGNGMFGMAWELVRRDIRLLKIARQFKPDVMMAQTGVSACRVGTLLRIPSVVLEECEHAKLQRLLSLPFADRIMTGSGYLHDHGKKQRRFRGIWVQPYLAPGYYTPQKAPLIAAGLDPDKPYIVMRTVAWQAAHDFGHQGTGEKALRAAIDQLEPYGRIILSTEKTLPDWLKPYANPVAPEHVHHLLAFARLYIGEGATMAAEAGVLGTPSIKCNPLDYGYLLALEQEFGLVRNTYSLEEGIEAAKQLFEQPDLKQQWRQKADCLWQQTDDIVDFTMFVLDELHKDKQV